MILNKTIQFYFFSKQKFVMKNSQYCLWKMGFTRNKIEEQHDNINVAIKTQVRKPQTRLQLLQQNQINGERFIIFLSQIQPPQT